MSDNPLEHLPLSSTTHPLPPPLQVKNCTLLPTTTPHPKFPQNPKFLVTFRRLGTFVWLFVFFDRERKSIDICGLISATFAKLQDLGFGFGACVNRHRASSRNYRQLAPMQLKPQNNELAFGEI